MTIEDFGIVDEPILSGKQDYLDISEHADALTTFISKCATPLTIGIQGEWGSGKTSLINTIWSAIAEDHSGVKQIWINAWENALLCSPEESLLKITNEIIDELLLTDTDKHKREKISKAASGVFKSAVKMGAAVSLGAKAADLASEILSGEDNNAIKHLRQSLNELVLEIRARETNPYQRIVVYIDDLDRLEPKNAVVILELLKNIFSIPHCVFVLAIDYQVVVKGLEDKFGPQTEANEWEFRAFFDKIIQLPFMMPTGKYNINKYLTNLLSSVGYKNAEEIDAGVMLTVVQSTTGGNPRALKRLANSVALIQIFDKSHNSDASKLTQKQRSEATLALVALQIAHPDIYDFLSRHPNIDVWDQALAYSITGGKEEVGENFERDFSLARQTEDFDEEWEHCIYRICYPKPRYRARAAAISQLLSILKDEIIGNTGEVFAIELEGLLSQTSVTNVTSTSENAPAKSEWKSEEEKQGANALWNLILDAVSDTDVFARGNRNGSSGLIRLRDKRFPIANFALIQNKVGIALWLNGGHIEQNQAAFDFLYSNRERYEQGSGLKFKWVRKETSKRQSIILDDPFCDEFNRKYCSGKKQVPDKEGWGDLISWVSIVAPKAEAVFIQMLSDFEQFESGNRV